MFLDLSIAVGRKTEYKYLLIEVHFIEEVKGKHIYLSCQYY
jgi:hypothetical protein